MKTRSQSKVQSPIIYEVNIDFDTASKAWKSNKKPIGNGCYKYKCLAEINGKCCEKICYKQLNYCWAHRNHYKKSN